MHFVNAKPAIDVVKTPDLPTLVDKAVGETVVFTYVVKNTGNVALENVDLIDNLEGNVSLGGTLAVTGAGWVGAGNPSSSGLEKTVWKA